MGASSYTYAATSQSNGHRLHPARLGIGVAGCAHDRGQRSALVLISPLRRAYLRACNRFLGWCEDRGLTLAAIRPHDVATYIEELQAARYRGDAIKQAG